MVLTTNQDIQSPIRFYHVTSGSMEPTIPTGSVVITQSQQDYQPNDIITFSQEGNSKRVVTHRITQIMQDPDIGKFQYQTQGDANTSPDIEGVDPQRVIGKVLFHIPYLGYPVGYAQTQYGLILLIIIPATIIIYSELNTIKNELHRMWKQKKQKKQQPVSEQTSS